MARSRATKPDCSWPPMPVNAPPTKRCVASEDSANAFTGRFGSWFHEGLAAPVTASRAARRGAVKPPTETNDPPTYTVAPSGVAARDDTGPTLLGTQAGSVTPVVLSAAPRLDRASPPRDENCPPTKSRVPSEDSPSADTFPLVPETHAVGIPAESTWLRSIEVTPPTFVKFPPMKTWLPSAITARDLTLPSTLGFQVPTVALSGSTEAA